MLAPFRSIYSSRRGAALVELAIVLVVLMLLVTGIMEFGLMFRNYLDVAQSVSAGCRSAALGSSTSVVNARITSTLSALGLNSAYSTSTVLQYRTYTQDYWSVDGMADTGQRGERLQQRSIKHNSRQPDQDNNGLHLSTRDRSVSVPDHRSNGNVSLSGTCAMRREQTP